MPHDDPDPEDPSLLVGVSLPGSVETTRDMAWTFAEEFAGLGHGEEWILRMFRTPSLGAAHRAFLALGEEEIAAIVRETVAVYGRMRSVTRDAGAPRPLPVVGPRHTCGGA